MGSKKGKIHSLDYLYRHYRWLWFRKDGYFDVESSKYADQAKVFSDLGRSVLDNAWNGFNASLFAYGQTGSGKSYSVFGYGVNKGIVPLFAEALFQVQLINTFGKPVLQLSLSGCHYCGLLFV